MMKHQRYETYCCALSLDIVVSEWTLQEQNSKDRDIRGRGKAHGTAHWTSCCTRKHSVQSVNRYRIRCRKASSVISWGVGGWHVWMAHELKKKAFCADNLQTWTLNEVQHFCLTKMSCLKDPMKWFDGHNNVLSWIGPIETGCWFGQNHDCGWTSNYQLHLHLRSSGSCQNICLCCSFRWGHVVFIIKDKRTFLSSVHGHSPIKCSPEWYKQSCEKESTPYMNSMVLCIRTQHIIWSLTDLTIR